MMLSRTHCTGIAALNMVDTDIQWSEYLEIIAEQQGVSNGSGSVNRRCHGTSLFIASDARMSLALAHPVDKSWFWTSRCLTGHSR